MSPDLADRLSLSLDDSQEGQGNLSVNKTMRNRTLSVVGIEIRQYSACRLNRFSSRPNCSAVGDTQAREQRQ